MRRDCAAVVPLLRCTSQVLGGPSTCTDAACRALLPLAQSVMLLHESACKTECRMYTQYSHVSAHPSAAHTPALHPAQGLLDAEQQGYLDRMELPPGVAANAPLRENVFVALVCILCRFPLFLVGKPGSSKSLALQLINANLRGHDAKDPFLRTLSQVGYEWDVHADGVAWCCGHAAACCVDCFQKALR